jgi:hypothetical protein
MQSMNRCLGSLLFFLLSLAACVDASCHITAGAEIYHFIRNREGGTHQDGPMKGFRISFDRIKRYGIYMGAEYIYGQGSLEGKTATGRPLSSELTDNILEFRLGITLQQPTRQTPFFTPFAGWGHFHEVNKFFSPSPLPCTFTDTFHYFVAGFLSGINFTPLLSMGVNFKLKFMQDAKSMVSEDPIYDDVTLLIKDELLARLDIPFYYHPQNTLLNLGFELTPFFEYRHFGGREGFPFNFKDTKFYLYGARIALTYPF